MKKVVSLAAVCGIAASISFAGTPTIDGTFDGTSVWGSAVATNSTAGFGGVTATALYVTDDADYVYFGASVTGLQSWMNYGFAIDSKSGGGNTPEPWGRQITFAFPTAGDLDAPDFCVRANFEDGNWRELRQWNGTDWGTGGGVDITTSEASLPSTNGFCECRIAKSTLNMRASKQGQVEFFVTGNQDAHGLFCSVPYDAPDTDWEQSSPNLLSNPATSVALPVSLSSFTIE
jgi:hypothetical protein